MAKLLLILLIGLVFEATGVVLLKKGIAEIGEIQKINAAEMGRIVRLGATNPAIWCGIFFEALFFGCLLILMAKSDISFLWPLTALSFVLTTIAALLFLHETVSPVRWAGVVFIMIGAALISYSQHVRDKRPPSTASEQERSHTTASDPHISQQQPAPH